MASSSSRTVFLSLVQRAGVALRRQARFGAAFIRQLCFAVLRAAFTGVVFATCVMVMLYYLGVPVPGPAELLDKFESIGRLADILS